MGKHFQCQLADTVNLVVSIHTDFCCRLLVGVVVQFVLFSFLCYDTRCPLQAPNELPCPPWASGPTIHCAIFSTEENQFWQAGPRTQARLLMAPLWLVFLFVLFHLCLVWFWVVLFCFAFLLCFFLLLILTVKLSRSSQLYPCHISVLLFWDYICQI